MQLACVPPDRAAEFWPFADAWIRSAVERCGDWTLDQIRTGVLDGRYLLWIAVADGKARGAAVTRIVAPPRICEVVACGGDCRGHIPRLLKVIEDFARRDGCDRVRISGRRGWARMLRDYRQPFITLEKVL
jgi:hypothetical protein